MRKGELTVFKKKDKTEQQAEQTEKVQKQPKKQKPKKLRVYTEMCIRDRLYPDWRYMVYEQKDL